jgi:ribokinase
MRSESDYNGSLGAAPPTLLLVGSFMMDMIAYVDRVPEAGETVRSRSFSLGCGGKGANQAVMAALLGAQVSMVGCVGDDVFGQMTLDNFKRLGIDVVHVVTLAEMSTGVAPIWVEDSGANRIIIVAGANDYLLERHVSAAFVGPDTPDVILCQLEIPQAAVRRAFELGKEHGSANVLNPAPIMDIDPRVLELSDWLIPNEHEFAAIAERVGADPDWDMHRQVMAVGRALKTNLVVTRGAYGASLYLPSTNAAVEDVRAPRVDALDTTGAGDAFVGAFSYALARGANPRAGVELGCRCAAASVTRLGTQVSFPRGDELATLVGDTLGARARTAVARGRGK